MLKIDCDVVGAHMTVCGACGELSGAFVDVAHAALRTQRCGCARGEAEADEPLWPRYDFNRGIELCRRCAGALVISGSRHSWLFCEACGDEVAAWNRSGAGGIPFRRHCAADESDDPAAGESSRAPTGALVHGAAVARRLHGVRARIAYLDDWRLRTVRAVLGEMGGRASVPDYLAAVRAGPARRASFDALCAQFEARLEEPGPDGRPSPEEKWPDEKLRLASPAEAFASWPEIRALYAALIGRASRVEEEAAAKAHYDALVAARREGERRYAQHLAQLRFFDLDGEEEVEPAPER
jgi:hypothetical protein